MSLDDTAETTNAKERERAKSEFFGLVDKREYEQARDYFNRLDGDKKRYIRMDKMGEARLKEIKFKRW